MLKAKTVIADRYWILQSDTNKVGEIERNDEGSYNLKVQGRIEQFKTLNMINQRLSTPIDFVNNEYVQQKQEYQVHGYPTNCKPYNPLFNVVDQLPVFTKGEHSKSWFAAGWYQVNQKGKWKTILCPKLIMLDRYEHRGPFRSKEEIISSIKDRL